MQEKGAYRFRNVLGMPAYHELPLLSPSVGHFRFSTRSRIIRFSEGGDCDLGNLPSKVMVEARLLMKAAHEGQTRRWAFIIVREEGGRSSSRKSEDRPLTSGQSISPRRNILRIELQMPIRYSPIVPPSRFQALSKVLGRVLRLNSCHSIEPANSFPDRSVCRA